MSIIKHYIYHSPWYEVRDGLNWWHDPQWCGACYLMEPSRGKQLAPKRSGVTEDIVDWFIKFANRAGRLPANVIAVFAIVLVGACSDPIDQQVLVDAGTQPAPVCTVNLYGSPSAVVQGGITTLAFQAVGTAQCRPDGNWLVATTDESGAVVRNMNGEVEQELAMNFAGLTQGSRLVGPSESHKYTIVCTCPSGEDIRDSEVISVLKKPRVDLWANKTSNPHEYMIQSAISEALSCVRYSNDSHWTGSGMEADPVMVTPSERTTYTLGCIGPGGSNEETVELEPW